MGYGRVLARPGGRVRKLLAVEDQSGPIPEEVTSKLGGKGKERPGALLARRTRMMKLCSSDARSKGHPLHPSLVNALSFKIEGVALAA